MNQSLALMLITAVCLVCFPSYAKAAKTGDKKTTATKAAAPANALYSENFEQVKDDQVPNEIMVLEGEFKVVKDNDNHVLELAGEPLGNYNLLFGPTQSDGVVARARIKGQSTRRLEPEFALGLCGVRGYRLQVAPARDSLELLNGDETLTKVPYQWKSLTWTWLALQARKAGEGKWIVEGKAWPEGSAEPAQWMISAELREEPLSGRASVWGVPHSGKPIQFDDLLIQAIKAGKK